MPSGEYVQLELGRCEAGIGRRRELEGEVRIVEDWRELGGLWVQLARDARPRPGLEDVESKCVQNQEIRRIIPLKQASMVFREHANAKDGVGFPCHVALGKF